MPFRGTTQDSRDPNSPQWGYLKVKNPEALRKKLKNETDANWNEYVLFVHDTKSTLIKENCLTNKKGIKARTDVNFELVPAELTIKVKGSKLKIPSKSATKKTKLYVAIIC